MSDTPKKNPAVSRNAADGPGVKPDLDAGKTILPDKSFMPAASSREPAYVPQSENPPSIAPSSPMSEMRTADTVPAGLMVGRKVGAGRFALIRELGRGGMGVVWLARDGRLNEDTALKFLPPEVAADAIALDDLRQETKKSRRLAHPHIIRIHDLYEVPGELPFISMEFVDGSNLTLLRLQQPQRCFGWDFLHPLITQLCAALDYAHDEKIIHRDLKPSNLMLDSRGRLKLADFGIAATLSDSMSRVSVQHATSGTLVYMSPEQMNGHKPRVTDDIYSLGATLYELLSSKPPFYAGNIMHQVLNTQPQPLPDRLEELELINEIPNSVSITIIACLAKEGRQRPRSAQAVLEQLASPAPPTPAPAKVDALADAPKELPIDKEATIIPDIAKVSVYDSIEPQTPLSKTTKHLTQSDSPTAFQSEASKARVSTPSGPKHALVSSNEVASTPLPSKPKNNWTWFLHIIFGLLTGIPWFFSWQSYTEHDADAFVGVVPGMIFAAIWVLRFSPVLRDRLLAAIPAKLMNTCPCQCENLFSFLSESFFMRSV